MIARACKAREVYGIEISEKGVEIARKNGIKCYQLDVDEEDFPFEDNFFDAVSALELIEHLYDPDHFLDEVYRVKARRDFCSEHAKSGFHTQQNCASFRLSAISDGSECKIKYRKSI